MDQLWNPGARFPSAPSAGLIDTPVGVGTTLDNANPMVFVGGTWTFSNSPPQSRYALAKYDAGGSLIRSVRWPKLFTYPPVTSVYTCTRMAVWNDATVQAASTIVALSGTHLRDDGYIDCITIAYHDDGAGPKLIGTATLTLPIDVLFNAHPVAVAISPSGGLIGVTAEVQLLSDPPTYMFATAIYGSVDMQVVMKTQIYEPSGVDRPGAMLLGDGQVWVAGSSLRPTDPTKTDFSVVSYSLDGSIVPGWPQTLPTPGVSNAAKAIAPYQSAAGIPGPGDVIFVVGTSGDATSAQMLTAAYWPDLNHPLCPSDPMLRWVQFDGVAGPPDRPMSASAFAGVNPGDLPLGDYCYATRTVFAPGGTTDIFTKLYRDYPDPLNNVCFVPEDRWPDGARWNNGLAAVNDEVVQVTVTRADTRQVEPERTTRTLVQGWTTNQNGDRDFVVLKYNANSQGGNKDVVWAKIQEFGMAGQQTATGLAYKMIGDFLNFFSTGTTNDSASIEDWFTIRFRENCEPQ